MDYFNSHPGVYFKTTGWIERGEADGELGQLALGKKLGLQQSYEEMVAKYGEENAQISVGRVRQKPGPALWSNDLYRDGHRTRRQL